MALLDADHALRSVLHASGMFEFQMIDEVLLAVVSAEIPHISSWKEMDFLTQRAGYVISRVAILAVQRSITDVTFKAFHAEGVEALQSFRLVE